MTWPLLSLFWALLTGSIWFLLVLTYVVVQRLKGRK